MCFSCLTSMRLMVSPLFEGKLGVFISYLSEMKIVRSIALLYSSIFYSLFLPFFVLEIFKFKYDKVFVRHSASISKFEWFEQPWDISQLRKTLRSHKNRWSLTDLSGANIGFHSNSRDWLFWVFMMSKINPLMNKSALFWQDV